MWKLWRSPCFSYTNLLAWLLQLHLERDSDLSFLLRSGPLLYECHEWECVKAEYPHLLRFWCSVAGCFGFLRQPSLLALQKPALTGQELMILSRCLCHHAVGWELSHRTLSSLKLNMGGSFLEFYQLHLQRYIWNIVFSCFKCNQIMMVLVFLWVTVQLVCDWHSVWV